MVEPDWSRWYADRSDWPLDNELFLAEAVLRFAPMAVFPWLDEFPVASAAAPAPLLPGTLDAFEPDGTPRPGIYERWAPAVLAYMSAAEFTSMQLERSDRAAWLAAHVVDAETGHACFDEAKAYTRGADISMEHWDHAASKAAITNDLREAGLRAMRHVARSIAEMAMGEHITVVARPINGSDERVTLSPSDWMVDDPIHRISSCAISMDDRFSPSAPPTHLLFVEREGFDAAAWIQARRRPLALLDEGIMPIDAGVVGPKPTALWKALEDRAYGIMRKHLIENATQHQRPKLRAAVEARMGAVGVTIFEHARERLLDEFPHLADGGAPRGTVRR
jgi:hypothetical protein